MLEVVQIEKDHRQGRAVFLRDPDRVLGAFCQQRAVGQAGERVVVRQPVDAFLVVLAVVDLAVQALDGFAELARALLDLLLQFGVHAGEFRLRLALLAHVHGDADAALFGKERVQRLAAHLAGDRAAVLGEQFHLAGEARAVRFAVAVALHGLPVGIAEMPLAGRSFGQLARRVAQHLLEMPVAAGEPVVAHECDAHHRVVEQRLLLPDRRVQPDLRVALLVDVIDDPDRSFGGVQRIDEAAREAGPEEAAVLAPHLALAAVGQPEGKGGVGRPPEGAEGRGIGVEALAAQPDRLAGGGVAEYFRISGIAADHLPLPDEHDTHAGTVQ